MWDILAAFGWCCVGAMGLIGAVSVLICLLPRKDRKGGFTQ